MPVFFFICATCKAPDRRVLTPAGARTPQRCRKTDGCAGILDRDVQVPAMHHKEIIDNGTLVRRVEQDVDAERLVRERASKDYRQRE
jgi:hypothetical protein